MLQLKLKSTKQGNLTHVKLKSLYCHLCSTVIGKFDLAQIKANRKLKYKRSQAIYIKQIFKSLKS